MLLRATTDMQVYEQALEAAGVPTYVIGGRGYWSHPQVIELVAYLRALANPQDDEAFSAVLLSPLCGLSLDGLVLDAPVPREELAVDDRARLAEFEAWFEASGEPPPGWGSSSCSTVRCSDAATSCRSRACLTRAAGSRTCAS